MTRAKIVPLFTFVIDYEGGTYVSQQSGTGPWEAFAKWRSSLLAEETVAGVSMGVFKAISDEDRESLIPLDAVHNVWTMSGLADEDLVLLNKIQTAV